MDTIGIPVAFVIISAILLWFVIGSKGNWLLKAVVIAATLCFSLGMWNSVEGLQGWPTKEPLPAKFLLHWAVIEEGNKQTDTPGNIYLWVEDMADKNENPNWFSFLPKQMTDKPRVYKVPYSRAVHEQLQKAMEGMKKGKRFVGENKNGKIGNGEGEGKDGKGEGGKGKGKGYDKPGQGKKGPGGEFDFSQEQDIVFHELPPAKLPPKDEEDFEQQQQNNPFSPDAKLPDDRSLTPTQPPPFVAPPVIAPPVIAPPVIAPPVISPPVLPPPNDPVTP